MAVNVYKHDATEYWQYCNLSSFYRTVLQLHDVCLSVCNVDGLLTSKNLNKIYLLHQSTAGAVLGKNIWGAWPLIICEATTSKTTVSNCPGLSNLSTVLITLNFFFWGGGQDLEGGYAPWPQPRTATDLQMFHTGGVFTNSAAHLTMFIDKCLPVQAIHSHAPSSIIPLCKYYFESNFSTSVTSVNMFSFLTGKKIYH